MERETKVLEPDVVDRYLRRIGVAERPTEPDLPTLTGLMVAHLRAVPFENLDVFHLVPVRTDLAWSVPKIVDRRRGGWCFELNGAFGALLRSLGYDVTMLGAAVLLNGPNVVLDHLCLEVMLDRPLLVDVGFGDTFIRPLDLNADEEQDGGNGTYQFMASPIGTTLTRIVDGVPEAQYRFKRVAHRLADFDAAAEALASNPEGHFRAGPVVSRLLDGDGARVTLSRDRLVIKGPDGAEQSSDAVSSEAWWPTGERWFGIRGPIGPGSADAS